MQYICVPRFHMSLRPLFISPIFFVFWVPGLFFHAVALKSSGSCLFPQVANFFSKTLQWYIYLCIVFFCSCWGFSIVCKKPARLQRKCPKGVIASWVCDNFWICDFFCGKSRFFCKFSLESKRANYIFTRTCVGEKNRSNSGKLFETKICVRNWKKCIELSISVWNDHRGKKSATLEGRLFPYPFSQSPFSGSTFELSISEAGGESEQPNCNRLRSNAWTSG